MNLNRAEDSATEVEDGSFSEESTFFTESSSDLKCVFRPKSASPLLVKKTGWLKLKGRLNKSRNYFFEIDELTEIVNYFKNDSKDLTKNRIIGSFSLEGAFVSEEDRLTKGKAKNRIVVKTKNNKKIILTAQNSQERDEWLDTLRKARNQAQSSKELIEQWKDAEECVKCMMPITVDQAQQAEEDVSTTEDEDFPDFFSLQLQDTDGKVVEMKTIIGGKLTLLLLMRHFGCMLCRLAVGRILGIKQELDNMGIQVVAVGNGTPENAKIFAKEFNFTGKLYTDTKKILYKALSCKNGVRYNISRKTMQMAKVAYAEGFRQGSTQGDMFQLGGTFVISKTGEMVYTHVDQYAGDLADLGEVLRVCRKFQADNDKWSSKPLELKRWDEVQDLTVQQNLIQCRNSLAFKFEFGRENADTSINIEDYFYYYADNFVGKPHTNYLSDLSTSEEKESGGVCISVEAPGKSDKRAIIRTRQEDYRVLIPQSFSTSSKEMLKFLKTTQPQLAAVNLSEIDSPQLIEDLIDYEDKMIVHGYKFGVIYAKEGQRTESEWYNNAVGSEAFEDFMQLIAKKIVLKGFKGYRGGLDVKGDTTGTHSYHSVLRNLEIMFHVSTLLPFQEKDTQKVERKRHIGNDIVVIIFSEGNTPIDPSIIASHYNHVFIVVHPEKDIKSGKTTYRVGIAQKSGVPPYGPFLPNPAIFQKGDQLKEFLLAKLINAERSALLSPEFKRKEMRTRKISINEFIRNYNLAKYRVSGIKLVSRKAKESMSSFKEPTSQTANQFKNIMELANSGLNILKEKDEDSEEVKKILDQIHQASGQTPLSPGRVRLSTFLQQQQLSGVPTVEKIFVRRFGKKGTSEIVKQASIELLLIEAAKVLSIPNPMKVRDVTTEEEILDVKAIKNNQVVFITAFEEERDIFLTNCEVCVDDAESV